MGLDLDLDTVVKIPVTAGPGGTAVLGKPERLPARPRTVRQVLEHVDRCLGMVVAEIEMIEALMVRKPGQRWTDKLRARIAAQRPLRPGYRRPRR